jgi:4'-phosphopantetheinyl transferase EntD
MSADRELIEALHRIAPPSVSVGVRRLDSADESRLRDGEREHVRRARPARRREFATGRALLRELIGHDIEIPAGDDRAPVLPPGVRASLAHDCEYAVAAATWDAGIAAVGIDVESVDPREPELDQLIVRTDEAGLDPRMAFVAKEAAYKAWSSLGGRMLDHHDVHVSVSDDRFAARVDPDGTVLDGLFTTAAGRWLALVVVTTGQPAADT